MKRHAGVAIAAVVGVVAIAGVVWFFRAAPAPTGTPNGPSPATTPGADEPAWSPATESLRFADEPLSERALRETALFAAVSEAVAEVEGMGEGDAEQIAYALVGLVGASRANLNEAFRRVGTDASPPELAESIRADWARYPASRQPPGLRDMDDWEIERHGVLGTEPFTSLLLDETRVRPVPHAAALDLNVDYQTLISEESRGYLRPPLRGPLGGTFYGALQLLRSMGRDIYELDDQYQASVLGTVASGERVLLTVGFVRLPGAGLHPVSFDAMIDTTDQRTPGVHWMPLY